MMKKLLVMSIVAVLSLSVLFGCNGTAGTETPVTDDTTVETPVVDDTTVEDDAEEATNANTADVETTDAE